MRSRKRNVLALFCSHCSFEVALLVLPVVLLHLLHVFVSVVHMLFRATYTYILLADVRIVLQL